MKRSAQVALVLMGVTGTTAAGAYMMPPRPECRAQPAASTMLSPPAALPQAGAAAAAQGEQPCRRRRWGSWGWSSGSSYSSYSSNRSQPLFSNRAPTSVSTALSGNRSGSTSTSTSAPRSGSTGTSRGGFGSTGHSMSGHSGGS